MEARFNCWEQQAAALLSAQGFDLVEAWPLLWRTPFNLPTADPVAIGTAFRSINFEVQQIISEVFGVEVTEHCPSRADEALDLLERHLGAGLGVLLFADAFHCSWSPAFGNYHNSHFVIARNVDRAAGRLIVDDFYHSQQGLELALASFSQAHGSLFSFRFPPGSRDGRRSARDLLALAMARSLVHFSEGPSTSLERLSQIVHDYSYERETSRYEQNWWSSPLFAKLLKLEYAHDNIALALQREDDDLAPSFKALARNWESLRVLLIGGRDPRVAARIERSVEGLVQRMKIASRQIEQQLAPADANPMEGVAIDLREHFDTRLFDTALVGSDDTPRLSRGDWQHAFQVGSKLVRFDLGEGLAQGNDCLMGRSQIIDLGPAAGDEAFVLYTRQRAVTPVSISLLDAAGARQQYQLSANSLTEIIEQPADRVHWAELSAPGREPTLRMGYLYVLRIPLTRSSGPRLQLPDDPDLRVLAITVA